MTEISAGIHPPKPPEAQKPERLSDEQMGNLLSAFGNHEAKAITLITMRSGDVFDMNSLHRQILNVQGENKGWKIGFQTPFGYCVNSLSPIGLVAREAFGPDLSTFGYSITDYGKELGIPLAGLLLNFSERHNISLGKLLGATVSKSTSQVKEGIGFKKRPPITTLKVIYELVTSPSLPLRETDVVEAVGEKSNSVHASVQDTLHRLGQMGIIQYESNEVNKGYSEYKISDIIPAGEPPAYKTQSTLTQLIFNILKENRSTHLTIEDVINFLPKDMKGRNKSRSLQVNVSCVLSHLTKSGYADSGKFHLGKMSEVNLTDEQRMLLAEFLEIIYKFQNKDRETLQEGRRLAGEIISNPQRVSNLLRRAKESSSFANKMSIEETKQDMLSVISVSSQGFTNKEIYDALKRAGRLLGRGHVANIMFILEKEGVLRSVKKGSEKRYFYIDRNSG